MPGIFFKDICMKEKLDWEYLAEKLAWYFYGLKYNPYDYYETKNICIEEVAHFMEDDNDSLAKVRFRIRYRIKGLEYSLSDRQEFMKRMRILFQDQQFYNRNPQMRCFLKKGAMTRERKWIPLYCL